MNETKKDDLPFLLKTWNKNTAAHSFWNVLICEVEKKTNKKTNKEKTLKYIFWIYVYHFWLFPNLLKWMSCFQITLSQIILAPNFQQMQEKTTLQCILLNNCKFQCIQYSSLRKTCEILSLRWNCIKSWVWDYMGLGLLKRVKDQHPWINSCSLFLLIVYKLSLVADECYLHITATA